MTRKDYVLLAEAFKQARELNELRRNGSDYYPTRNGIDLAQDRVADLLRADNPRFDRTRFDAACGI
jgi:hypothetical protein